MSILRANNICKSFTVPDEVQILKNISFEINEGEFVSIMGKSGCGKSTLLYVLSTMDTDYEGQLFFNNELLTGKDQNYLARFRNEHIGFVFQFHYLLANFTVLQNVMLPALKLGKLSKEEIEHKAFEKLRMLDMQDYAASLINNLSGGQQQRVAIARALINDPMVIMGDEPTGNLDSVNSGIVFDIFKELSSKHQQTIIVVTHDKEFAHNTDRMIEMKDGEIV